MRNRSPGGPGGGGGIAVSRLLTAVKTTRVVSKAASSWLGKLKNSSKESPTTATTTTATSISQGDLQEGNDVVPILRPRLDAQLSNKSMDQQSPHQHGPPVNLLSTVRTTRAVSNAASIWLKRTVRPSSSHDNKPDVGASNSGNARIPSRPHSSGAAVNRTTRGRLLIDKNLELNKNDAIAHFIDDCDD